MPSQTHSIASHTNGANVVMPDAPGSGPTATSASTLSPSAMEAPESAASVRNARGARRSFGVLAAVVLATGLGTAGYAYATAGWESTDDAQVVADIVPLAARVSGQILELAIVEDQLVKKGDLIARLDDADYVAKLRQAEAELDSSLALAAAAAAQVQIVEVTSRGSFSTARAAHSGSSASVASAEAQVAALRARLVGLEAEHRKLDADLKRIRELHASGVVAREQLDAAQSAFDVSEAGLVHARAQVTAAEQDRRAALLRVSEAAGRVEQSSPVAPQIAAAKANAQLAEARAASARAAVDLARLQLSYTRVFAPAEGYAAKVSVHPGQLIAAGQPILQLVPTHTYVIANFKETQLGSVRAGRRAAIEVDAYPDRSFEGVVQSISRGTGASFALLPPDNASGNFVKVVQRVPVRIAWLDLPPEIVLQAGMSVEATVK